MKTKLRNIINKGASNLSNEDKIFIKKLALENGLPKNTLSKKKCASTYIDVAVILAQKLEEEGEETEVKEVKPQRRIEVKKGVDILVNGVRVNRYTVTTDEQAEKLLALIGDKYFEFN